jgi:molybdate transport system permease protein
MPGKLPESIDLVSIFLPVFLIYDIFGHNAEFDVYHTFQIPPTSEDTRSMSRVASTRSGHNASEQARRELGSQSKRWLRGSWKAAVLPLIFFITIPLLALLLRADPVHIWSHLQLAQVQQAIQLSLLTTFAAVAVTVLFGTPVAYYLSHRHYRHYRLVDTLVDLPTVLPPAVAGVALLMAFGRNGLLGTWLADLGISLPFTPIAVIMAQVFVAAPLYVKSAALGFSSVNCELKKSAALDGANRWQTFRYIILPISWAAILNGCVLTWARALGEFGATIIFAGNFPGRTQTMPLAIYIGFELDLTVALTLSVILIALSFLVLIIGKALLQPKIIVDTDATGD